MNVDPHYYSFDRNTRLPRHAFRNTRRTPSQWLAHKARLLWALVIRKWEKR